MRRREFVTLLGGAAATWPMAARAQQPAMPVAGLLLAGSTAAFTSNLAALRKGLSDTGYIEGENVTIEYHWLEGQYDRLPGITADLVRRRVAVIVAPGSAPAAIAAKAATSTIPIVFDSGIDPVQSGLVASLSRPGGNITGVALLTVELMGKRLELLHELLPKAAVVTLLVNPGNPVTDAESKSLQEAAGSLGLRTHELRAGSPSEIEAAFETLAGLRADALVVSVDTLFTSQREQIVALAARHAVPAIYGWRLFPAAGGLISYGSDIADSYRQLGVYTAKILKGAKSADLPVQQVVKLDLVINLRTAKALGLTIPPLILARADEVIE